MSLNNSNKGRNDEKEQEDLLIAEQEQDLPAEIEAKKKGREPYDLDIPPAHAQLPPLRLHYWLCSPERK